MWLIKNINNKNAIQTYTPVHLDTLSPVSIYSYSGFNKKAITMKAIIIPPAISNIVSVYHSI